VPPRGPWLLTIDHPGVAAELATLQSSPLSGPGLAAFGFDTLTALHAALDRVYKLGVSLPGAPLARFRAQTASLPETTEAERLVIQRIGQDIFRAALMDYWGGRCPITGITDPALLRASHIVPWAECDDAQRLAAIIRAHCLDCCGGSSDEVRKCTALDCPSWPFRIGTNPWRAPLSEAERTRRRDRIARVGRRAGNSPEPEKPRGVEAASPSAPISARAAEASEP